MKSITVARDMCICGHWELIRLSSGRDFNMNNIKKELSGFSESSFFLFLFIQEEYF
jgi:hypothetical protein